MPSSSVKCWGYNGSGQLGQEHTLISIGAAAGQMGDVLAPIALGGVAKTVLLGIYHACALLADGRIKCWGYNTQGQLGIGDTMSRGTVPGQMGAALPAVDLGNDARATAIALGYHHSCALLEDGRVKCWGHNSFGSLGLPDDAPRGTDGGMGVALPAVDLGSGVKAKAIGAGGYVTCALLVDDTLKCWGLNSSGQLGQGDILQRGGGDAGLMGDALQPVTLGTLGAPAKLEVGPATACAVMNDGSLKCWGAGKNGLLGLEDNGANHGNAPNQMGDALKPVRLSSVTSVSIGQTHTCAVTEDRVKCWGENAEGQLGLGHKMSVGAKPGDMIALPFVDLGTE